MIGTLIPPAILLEAYRTGWFPMGEGEDVEWYSPDPRGVLPLGNVHVPRRLARTLRHRPFEIRVDTAFAETIRQCAARGETWITPVIVRSYERLHELGVAHSVEAWRDARLVGGLYGVALRGAFFGESMFHLETDASKAALCALVERLRTRGYRLLDVQWVTGHLEQFGAMEIPRRRYLAILEESQRHACQFA